MFSQVRPSPLDRIARDVESVARRSVNVVHADEAMLALEAWRCQPGQDRSFSVNTTVHSDTTQLCVEVRDRMEDRVGHGVDVDINDAVVAAFADLEAQPIPAQCEKLSANDFKELAGDVAEAVCDVFLTGESLPADDSYREAAMAAAVVAVTRHFSEGEVFFREGAE